jgi:hypothetical protein
MNIMTKEYKIINSNSMYFFLRDIKLQLAHKANIHLILDQDPYNKNEQTKNTVRTWNKNSQIA